MQLFTTLHKKLLKIRGVLSNTICFRLEIIFGMILMNFISTSILQQHMMNIADIIKEITEELMAKIQYNSFKLME